MKIIKVIKTRLTMHTLFFALLAFTVSLTSISSCSKSGNNPGSGPVTPPVVVNVLGKFDVQDSKIVDSNGVEFVAKGVNVNGPHWPWSRPTAPDVALIADVWKCNIVRVDCWNEFSVPNNNNVNLDEIVTTFTSKKVVTLLEDHNFTGRYPAGGELATAITWWTNLANKYKNNRYVWFNCMNEPGGGGAVPAEWLTVHEAIIKAIRATGAENVIVCDEHAFGQANGFSNTAGSAVLTYGEVLTSKYKNIAFSLHLYDAWIYPVARLENYIATVQAKKLALIIGEYGVGDTYSMEVAADMFKVIIPKKIGRIAWHWVGEDVHKLVNTGSGGGYDIDNKTGAKPGNLSYVGNLVWLDNHNTLQVTDPALQPPPVIITNADFEQGNPANNSTSINGWINFGTAFIDATPANVKQGSYAVKVAQGAAGGFGQPIYLQPGANYKITAWGKNSLVTTQPSIIALKYKTTAGGTESTLVSLDFTENSFQQKTSTFATPAMLESMFLVIYKNEAAPDFWCDDIVIQKL